MLRWLAGILLTLVLLAGAGWAWLDVNLRGAAEQAGARVLGVEVSVGAIRPADGGAIELRDLRIPNSARFGDAPLLLIERVRLIPDIGRLAVAELALERVELHGVTLQLRTRGAREVNILQVMDQVDTFRRRGLPRERQRIDQRSIDVEMVAVFDGRLDVDQGPALGRSGRFVAGLPDSRFEPIRSSDSRFLLTELVAEIFIEIASLTAIHDDRIAPELAERLRTMAEEQYDRPDRRLDRTY